MAAVRHRDIERPSNRSAKMLQFRPTIQSLTCEETQTLRGKLWCDDLNGTIRVRHQTWPERGYNTAHYATAGLWLGIIAGCASLILNVIGGVLWPAVSGDPQHPLRIILVYLTFPVGESALRLNTDALLPLGCLLYLGTGMLYGMLFELVIFYFLPHVGVRARLVAGSILALIVWTLNFYCLLAWVQPLLFGGRWIVDLIPWWVAASTHLVFGWTMALVYPLGTYDREERTPASTGWREYVPVQGSDHDIAP
jgi:hypothetical protein